MLLGKLNALLEISVRGFHVAARVGRIRHSTQCARFGFGRVGLPGEIQGQRMGLAALIDSAQWEAKVAAQMIDVREVLRQVKFLSYRLSPDQRKKGLVQPFDDPHRRRQSEIEGKFPLRPRIPGGHRKKRLGAFRKMRNRFGVGKTVDRPHTSLVPIV